MKLLLKLAWRNLWRNRRRSFIVLTAIVIGVASLLLTEGLVNGQLKQMLDNLIGGHLGHVQVQARGFEDNKTIQYRMSNPKDLLNRVSSQEGVVAVSPRLLSYGLISSASASSGVMMMGVRPELEKRVSQVSSMMVEGTYLSGDVRSVALGKKLAEKLGVSVGDKIVVMASRADGNVGSEAFRISGLFRTPNSEFDKLYIHVPIETAQSMLGVGDEISEMTIIGRDPGLAPAIRDRLSSALGPTYEVFTYADLAPTMVLMIEVTRESMGIYYVIIGLATIFGIINVLLMSVLERIREFGVVMAMGMSNVRVFALILLEAFLLGCVGGLVGVAAGGLIFWPLGVNGLDLGSSADAMTAIGVGQVIYPFLTWQNIVTNVFFVPLVAVLAAIYPARKAVRLEPVRAIAYV